MLIFAHAGIGRWLASPWKARLPGGALLLGTLLPDLIDKSLYYGLVIATGKHGVDLGLITGTRTFGHSLLFLALVLLGALRSRFLLALAAGVITHLLLDNFLEPAASFTAHSSRIALLFPYYGVRFPVAPHDTLRQHLIFHLNWLDMLAECVGISLLGRELWRRRAQG
jgi:hypothetical protein